MVRNVLLLDEHVLVREGMASLINRAGGLCVCCQASTVEEAASFMEDHGHALAITEYDLQGESGLSLIKTIRKQHREVPVLIVSSHEEPLYASRALRAGARGFIRKRDSGNMLIKAIRSILSGEIFVCDALREHFANTIDVEADLDNTCELELLSDREMEVMHLIGMGLGSSEIAHTLDIRPKTVETYRMRIKKKLYLTSGTALTRRAMEWVLASDTTSAARKLPGVKFENIAQFPAATPPLTRTAKSHIATG